jgi:Domain of unknown function (DUF3291)
MTFHLAQLNVARMRWGLDQEEMRGFVERLHPVNAEADAAPGFVWRLQTEEGDATAIRAFEDPLMLVNLSVWESLEALRSFVYRSGHLDPLRMRSEWFEPMDEAHVVLWWEPAGRIPTILEAKDRLARLRRLGPTPQAFTPKDSYPAPD